MFKRFRRFIVRVVSVAVILCLVIVLLPSISKLVSNLLPKASPQITSVILKQEMAKVGKLTTVEYTDTGILSAATTALFIGDVQKVTVPYTYQLALGIDLDQAQVSIQDELITFTVPALSLLYDKLTVTEDPTVDDFWYPLSEAQYQKILDTEEAARRKAYLDDPNAMEEAWHATTEKLGALFGQWLDGGWKIRIEKATP